jgi:hypothetical protein
MTKHEYQSRVLSEASRRDAHYRWIDVLASASLTADGDDFVPWRWGSYWISAMLDGYGELPTLRRTRAGYLRPR